MAQNSNPHSNLIISKLLQKVALWVHPEGKVLGSLFIREHSDSHAGHESPIEILNSPQDFVVLKRDDSNEVRFYNKSSIVRVEYNDAESINKKNNTKLKCKIHMMDGSLLDGIINENLPQAHSRLFDYINDHSNHFIKILISDNETMLINKSYVIRITPIE